MKTQEPRIKCEATCIEKKELPYEDIASTRGIPVIHPIYEVLFQSESEKILFALSAFEYAVLEAGMRGTLCYRKHPHYNEMISFDDEEKGAIIKEVAM